MTVQEGRDQHGLLWPSPDPASGKVNQGYGAKAGAKSQGFDHSPCWGERKEEKNRILSFIEVTFMEHSFCAKVGAEITRVV